MARWTLRCAVALAAISLTGLMIHAAKAMYGGRPTDRSPKRTLFIGPADGGIGASAGENPAASALPLVVSASASSSAGSAPPAEATITDCKAQPALGEVELASVLHEAHLQYFHVPPTYDRLACAWAHCALEHARGKKLFANNIGHITTSGAWKGPMCVRVYWERVKKSPDQWEKRESRFRVHPSLVEGAVDYWTLLNMQYPTVLESCDRGDIRAAAQELAKHGYFTGLADPYVQSMAGLFFEARGKILPQVKGPFWEQRKRLFPKAPNNGGK